jgi:hypothetical protein
MNTRIKHFVEHYKAVLALKRQHTKRISIRDFVVEAALIFFISFGIVPVLGLVGNLNESFAYLYVASVAMIVFNYIILMWLFETRYQLANKLDYNICYSIIPKTAQMLLVLFSGVMVYGTIVGFLLLAGFLESTGLAFFLAFMLFAVIVFIQSIVPPNRSLLPYLYQGIIIAGLYWMFGFVLNYNLYILWTYIAHVLIILIVIGRDWFVVSRKQFFLGPFGILFTMILLTVSWILFHQLGYGSNLDRVLTSESTTVRGASIQEGRIVGTYTDDNYVYIKYADYDGMYADVYNHEFEYQFKTDKLDLPFYFITIDRRVYAVLSDPEMDIQILYDLDGATFVEQFRVPHGYFLYGTIRSGDSFWFIKIDRYKNEDDEIVSEPTLYRAKDGIVTEEDLARYNFRHEDHTTTFEVKDGEVFIDTTNTGISSIFASNWEEINDTIQFKTVVSNQHFVRNYDTGQVTIYDNDSTVLATWNSFGRINDENYYTIPERPFLKDGVVYVPYTSGFHYQDQNIVAYALYETDGTLLDVYQSTEGLFYLNDTVYEIKYHTIVEYNQGGIRNYGSAVAMTGVTLFVGIALMIPLHTKIILIGGESNV